MGGERDISLERGRRPEVNCLGATGCIVGQPGRLAHDGGEGAAAGLNADSGGYWAVRDVAHFVPGGRLLASTL